LKNRWNKSLMAGGFRDCRKKLYWSLNRRELNERSSTCMTTACNRLKDAGRILFAAGPVIGASVMIRILRGMTKLIENMMDLMGR
jgi:hypothetical protein